MIDISVRWIGNPNTTCTFFLAEAFSEIRHSLLEKGPFLQIVVNILVNMCQCMYLPTIRYCVLYSTAYGADLKAPTDYTKPRQIVQSLEELYKAPTDYTKPRQTVQSPKNIIQSPTKLYKAL